MPLAPKVDPQHGGNSKITSPLNVAGRNMTLWYSMTSKLIYASSFHGLGTKDNLRRYRNTVWKSWIFGGTRGRQKLDDTRLGKVVRKVVAAGDSWHSSKIIHRRYHGWSGSNKISPPMGLRADSFECDVTRLIWGLWLYFRNRIAHKLSFRWILRSFHPHGWFYLSAMNPRPCGSHCGR